MQETMMGKLSHAWNVFRNKEPTIRYDPDYGPSTSYRPDKMYTYFNTKDSIVGGIYNRVAMDVASLNFRHILINDNSQYLETLKTPLNKVLSLEANIDQTGRAFIQDLTHSLCDEGVVALVPIETSINPERPGTFDINTIRVGRIVEWFPDHIRVDLYNKKTGLHENITVAKKITAIIENPLYSVMNEPNSVLQRLKNKLDLLDVSDEKNVTGKLDMVIQLPFAIKTERKREEAEKRRKLIESQMSESKYGIGYIDATEKITQLNRPVDNQLLPQVESLTSMLYNQLGLTQGVFDGTADEKEILNYYNRTIEPFANAIVDEMSRKFLTQTARTQGHIIYYFRDMFKLTPISELAELADKLTRNEILSSNEFRGIIGFQPSPDPKADELRNKNLNNKGEEVKDESKDIKDESKDIKDE